MSATAKRREQKARRAEIANKDVTARIGVVISALVAVASLAVSGASYQEQKHQFAEVQTEKLSISLSPLMYDPIRLTRINFGKEGRVVIQPWKLTLSNTGQQRLSITSYEVSEGVRPGQRIYTGLRSGMFNSQNQIAELPLTLEPGESKVFTLSVGALVSAEVAKVLAEEADPATGFVFKPGLALAKKNLDLLGNRVSYEEWATGIRLTTLTNKPAQTFWYAAQTGRNNTFYGSGHGGSPSPELERLDFNGK